VTNGGELAKLSPMARAPIVYRTTHQIRFSELDPYNHLASGNYATYFTDHRMLGLSEHLGWNLQALGSLPFMVWVRRLEIDFLRPVRGDQEVTISSFVRDFQGADAFIECTMQDRAEKSLARCLMVVAHVDKATGRSSNWPDERQSLFFQAE
jgi:acyl-CoA thioester hydrolase